MKKKHFLHNNWILKLIKKGDSCLPEGFSFPSQGIPAQIPGTVHTDLLSAGLISNPFYADNEQRLQWIQENEWLYETFFDVPEIFNLDSPLYLICQGLDTIAQISLNYRQLAVTKNMFRNYAFNIQHFVKTKDNKLAIHFRSPTCYARELEPAYGPLEGSHNTERLYLRKAQYSFGWDWGPCFPTMGIWRPVYLGQPEGAFISSVRFWTTELHQNSATIKLNVSLEGELNPVEGLNLELEFQHQKLRWHIGFTGENPIHREIIIPSPHLWYPNGMGEANLYNVHVRLLSTETELLDEWKGRMGIRTIELQTREKEHPIFRFIVNGNPVFIKGANWIPADSFLPRVSEKKYSVLLNFMKNAGMNMIRVWGGGIYEDEAFYGLCDELGLLVWQDFMFACGMYPDHPEFLENVKEEVKQNVEKLQHHPCIALWCGNNENEWVWYRKNHRPIEELPGYRIYHEIIPELLKELDPHRAYWPSTPFGNESDPNSESSGNRHQWSIWGDWEDYESVRGDRSLFVTEFGFQAPANLSTMEKAIPKNHPHPQSELFEYHNKQAEGTARLFRFLASHLPVHTTWEDFVYLTQLLQSLALTTCLEHWRSRWPHTAGSIIWQLNDCWPVTSWSLIDGEIKPKLSYYFVKRAFLPSICYFEKRATSINVWIMNHGVDRFIGELAVTIIEASSGNTQQEHPIKVNIESGSKEKIFSISDYNKYQPDTPIVITTLRNKRQDIIHRNVYTGKPWKYLHLPHSEVSVELKHTNGNPSLTIKSNKPAFFVDIVHPELIFSDRGFVLLPNETTTLTIPSNRLDRLDRSQIKIFTLNDYLRETTDT